MIDNMYTPKIILLGGDRREVELYRIWQNEGLAVRMVGFNKSPQVNSADYAKTADLCSADVLITPLSGIKADGTVTAVFTSDPPLQVQSYLEMPVKKYLLLAGSAAPAIRASLPAHAQAVYTEDNAELALLNAIPTAEGAIQKAMELSDITLHDSRALVIGLGRCGTVLARMLHGIGVRVTASVRQTEKAALAYTMNINAVPATEIEDSIHNMDFIFNIAPASVLCSKILKRVKNSAVIIDLASAPGGTDFEAAAFLGIKAVLLPGLPGKAAPLTAARILSMVYRRMITEKPTI